MLNIDVIYDMVYQVKAVKTVGRTLNYVTANTGEALRVIIEVWKIPHPEGLKYPDGFRFSIVAFLESNTEDSLVLDCHPPKGPHYHLNGEEKSFKWTGFDEAEALFWKVLEQKFGKIRERGFK